MELVPGSLDVLQGLSVAMTAPSFHSFTTILIGWVFAGRRTVARMILVAGESAPKTLLVVTNHDAKQHLGFEKPQGWTRRSVV